MFRIRRLTLLMTVLTLSTQSVLAQESAECGFRYFETEQIIGVYTMGTLEGTMTSDGVTVPYNNKNTGEVTIFRLDDHFVLEGDRLSVSLTVDTTDMSEWDPSRESAADTMDFIRLSSGCSDASELSRFIGRGTVSSTDGSTLDVSMYLAAIIGSEENLIAFSGHLSMSGGGMQFEVPIYLQK